MDKLEYIPGDFVMTNGVPLGTARYVVYRVTSSDQSKTLKFDDGTVLKGVVRLENLEGAEFGDKGYLLGDSCAWVKDIVPIPLTTEILEKNGWKKSKTNDCAYFYYKDGLFLTYTSKDGKFWLDDFDYSSSICVELPYIHSLQHLLFVLELNSEMEV
jgi:hypothetical protein|nr:MAG TPA: hypothetical protein [Caudoviricetes sp.]